VAMAASASGHGKPTVRKGVNPPKPLKSLPDGTHVGSGSAGAILQSLASDFVVSKPRSSGDFQSASVASGANEVIQLYGKVAKDLRDRRYNHDVVRRIVALNRGLKTFGPQLEATNKDALDKYQVFLRSACRDGTLDLVARLQLLEIIELRAMKWKPNDNVTNYYRNKMLQVEQCDPDYFHGGPNLEEGSFKQQQQQPLLNANAAEFRMPSAAGPPPLDSAKFCASATASLASMLAVEPAVPPGRVMVTKYDKPVRLPGKQQLREEVIIRNADSGKVEPGSKDRVVQVIGSDEATIELAKSLIEETIQRNASPEPVEVTTSTTSETNNNNTWISRMSGKAELGTYSYTVEVGGENIKVLGGNPEVVRAAKIALDEYFAGKSARIDKEDSGNTSSDSTDAVCQTDAVRITYDRRRLLAYSASPICRQPPIGWTEHWTNSLKAVLGRNFEPSSVQQQLQQQVDDGNDNVGGDAAKFYDWFVPSPEKFMSANARFPQGFVRLPAFYRPNANGTGQGRGGNGEGGGGGGHLDRLFAEGAKRAAQPQRTTTALETILAQNGKIWDEAIGQWVSSVAAGQTHTTRK